MIVIYNSAHKVSYASLIVGSVIEFCRTVAIKISDDRAVDLETGKIIVLESSDIIVNYYPKATVLLDGKD